MRSTVGPHGRFFGEKEEGFFLFMTNTTYNSPNCLPTNSLSSANFLCVA